jgi:hypothetical protein
MTAQAALFDLAAPPPAPTTQPSARAARPRRTAADWSAFHAALATFPRPAARGMDVCTACERPILLKDPATFLAVACKRLPGRQSQVDAEQIGFHAACHDLWWADRRARAWALVETQSRSLPGDSSHGR